MPDITPKVYNNLYVVFDKVAEEIFGGIIRVPNDEVARRAFHDLLNQKDSPIATNKGDYDLLKIGRVDNFGTIPGTDYTETIARGQDWLDANNQR